MQIYQHIWKQSNGWKPELPTVPLEDAQLVFIFGISALLKEGALVKDIKKICPQACLIGCSTAGEIYHNQVFDDSLTATIIHFEKSKIQCFQTNIDSITKSYQTGKLLADGLDHHGLVHVFLLSDGLMINGSELVRGVIERFPAHVTVTGGLAGDGDRFEQTFVLSEGEAQQHVVSAVGFYGETLKVGFGSMGGWDSFGPERVITRSEGNILYELDGKSALRLYKDYLGDHAAGLPATGLLFPLCIRATDHDQWVVRTILAVDDATGAMTFAGNIPQGSKARLMKANFDRLINGAAKAAKNSQKVLIDSNPELAILISCVGRKLILKQRVEEEVEAVQEILGETTTLTGFYSYGEISPFTPGANCELHNQTMTITTFSEK